MSIKSLFSEQLYSWLSSIGFECKLNQKPAEIFPVIEVWKNGSLTLEIKLVDINSWNEGHAADELKIYAAKQVELRSNRIFSVILWEDLWKKNEEIVKSRLKSILGISIRIPARLTYSVRIDKATASEFLTKNHLQGSVLSKYRFGLYLPVKYFRVLPSDYQINDASKDMLVAVATFSYARIFNHDEKPFRSCELIRFASLLNTTVVGGMDKLLNTFIREIKPDDIMTYVDLEWSDGASYHRLGFEEISEKPPISFLLDTQTNERFPIRKDVLIDNTIEICNAGSRKFVKIVEQKLKKS